MFVIVSKYLIPKGYRSITIFPFVFLLGKQDRENRVLVHHEKIHIRQQLELLVVFFYGWHFVEFIIRYFQYRNWNKAYRNISFEREAYANEKDLHYLKQRSFWRFLKYLSN